MKFHNLISILLFSLPLLITSIPVFADSKFEQIVESYKGKNIIINVPKNEDTLDYKTAFPGELLLGITRSHFYILVDDVRIDGKVPPIPSRKINAFVDGGLFIRFPDVSIERVSLLKEALSEEWVFQGFTWSCVNTACKNLRKRLGISLEGNRDGIFLSTTFDEILSNGFRDESGKSVRFEIYKTSREVPSISEIANHQRSVEKNIAICSAAMTSMITVAGVSAGILTFLSLRSPSQDSSEKIELAEPPSNTIRPTSQTPKLSPPKRFFKSMHNP